MTELNRFVMTFTPPSDSRYIARTIDPLPIYKTKQQTPIVFLSAVYLSRKVIFPVGLMPRAVNVIASSTYGSGYNSEVLVNATGYYYLVISPSLDVKIVVSFEYYGNEKRKGRLFSTHV
jgi:hypothetical protein